MKKLLTIIALFFATCSITAMQHEGQENKRPAHNQRKEISKKRALAKVNAPLREAISAGDYTKASSALVNGTLADTRDKDGITPLLKNTILHKNEAHKIPELRSKLTEFDRIAHLLLKNGANSNRIYQEGWPALAFAASNHANANLIALLCEYGADPNVIIPDAGTPLYIAVQADSNANPSYENIKALLAQGAKPSLKGAETVSPLFLAIANNKEQITRMLLEYGASLDYIECLGADYDTPLTKAIAGQNNTMVTTLLEHGADLEKETLIDTKIVTPLLRATLVGNIPAVELLLNHGANPNLSNVVNGVKKSLLEFMLELKEPLYNSIALLLAQYGATIKPEIMPLLHDLLATHVHPVCHAAGFGTSDQLHQECAKLSYEQLPLRDNALMWACSQHNIDTISYLLASKNKPHTQKAIEVVFAELLRNKKNSPENLVLLNELINHLPNTPESKLFLGKLFARSLRSKRTQFAQMFLEKHANIMPALAYLDYDLCRFSMEKQHDFLQLRTQLVRCSSLAEQSMRKIASLPVAEINKIHIADLKERVLQLRIIEHRIQRKV